MNILLVEPDHRRGSESFRAKRLAEGAASQDDETLWYPPLGLMKLSTFHKRRGDSVTFVNGCDPTLFEDDDPFANEVVWDRVYITTLFTFDWQNVIKTINFYKEAVGGSIHKIFVGGIMATLMVDELFEETGICPVKGVVKSPSEIGLNGDEEIDLLPPDYDILDSRLYAINDTFYGYATRGCTQKCPWCGVPEIEPNYHGYIDVKPYIEELRSLYGDFSRLKLMDNNVLASPHLEQIVDDLVALGFGRDEYTKAASPRMRVVDFNQGLDATHITKENLETLHRLNIRPMRVAFDRIQEKKAYVNALSLAKEYGFKEFSNYMLYNWKDSPRDLYDRLVENIKLNEKWRGDNGDEEKAVIYSFPMRFAPIFDPEKTGANRHRDWVDETLGEPDDFLDGAIWNRRFIRNVEVIKGAAHGAISPTPEYAWRAIGENYKEFISNLYMPEDMLRNRNRYEARIWANDPDREPGTGELEEFREFIFKKLEEPDEAFREFHRYVAPNTLAEIRKGISTISDPVVKHWLGYYLRKD